MGLSYLTADLPGTGGILKTRPADFTVEEIPLYGPCGEGEHVYLKIRKTGLATFEALRRIAVALGVPEARVAYAGLKDARAVTTQWISVQGIDPDAARALDLPRIEVLAVDRHTNKLKVGHLRGNRFEIVVRDAQPGSPERAAAVLAALERRGAPNYFGEQRFGSRRNGHRYGEAILRRDYAGFVQRMLGGPPGRERDPSLRAAREHFDAGRLREAYEAMPTRRRSEKKCLHALIRFEDPERAFFAIPRRIRRLYLSAYQSWLFNRVLEKRLDEFDLLREGDLAMLHRNGAVFKVVEPEAEQPRCATFEISPTAPLYGTRTPMAEGEPGRLEREVLAETGFGQADFAVGGGIRLPGKRRALRIPVAEARLEPLEATAYRVAFTLPRGSFATTVMRELMKVDELEPTDE